ncbi:MAG TPA: thiamine pyrophosphate-binding protein, partial [Spirochaetota bacterium]|nr:thiamine pyrophosphate-binding protein [Spirochaetota bacterium]
MSINGGHLIGSYLSRRGVQCVFGISGGHIESLLDGLQHYTIQTIDVRHEQAAVMMAHA